MTRPLGGADPPGATPLTPDELAGLIPTDVATRADLDEVELENIVAARTWAATRTWSPERLLTREAVFDLHRRMFGEVWRWAGTQRRRETSIGVAPEAIGVELRNLLDDTLVWIEHTTYDADVAALRCHHRLVQIHVFPNGNGRHARLCADLLARALGRAPFTWGGTELTRADAARAAYLRALRAMDADRDDVGPLLAFARA